MLGLCLEFKFPLMHPVKNSLYVVENMCLELDTEIRAGIADLGVISKADGI